MSLKLPLFVKLSFSIIKEMLSFFHKVLQRTVFVLPAVPHFSLLLVMSLVT